MSHASSAAIDLRGAVAEPIAATDAAGRDFVAAKRALLATVDLLPTMEGTVGLILALEALKDAAEHAEKAARTVLARTMASTGCTTLRTVAHTVSVKDGARHVIITGTVPPELMVQPPPAPDKKEIGRRLKEGERLEFATLSNGAEPTLQIRTREQKAA